MPRQLLLGLAAVSMCAFACDPPGWGSSEIAGCVATDAQWSDSLDLFAQRSPSALEHVTTGLHPPDQCSSALRSLLLAEWRLSSDADQLSHPRMVWSEGLKPVADGKRRHLRPMLVVRGRVSVVGRLMNPALKWPSGDEAIDQLVIESLKLARFRPAIRDSAWVEAEAVVTVHLQLE